MADSPITLSLVIPTISRPTLARTLQSVREQSWDAGDEILLVGDGPQPAARALWEQFRLPGQYLETTERLGFWGHGIRNWLMGTRAATGAYLMALDDDDALAPDAVATVRRILAESPGRPHVFRMSGHPAVGTVWKDRVIREANVGTPMLVPPNDPERLSRYALRYAGDHDFIRDTCAHYPDGPVWREEVICRVRPPR